MRGTKRGFRRTIASLLVFSLCIAAVPALPARADNKINELQNQIKEEQKKQNDTKDQKKQTENNKKSTSILMCFMWWAMTGSNCRHSACKADALPAELIARVSNVYYASFMRKMQALIRNSHKIQYIKLFLVSIRMLVYILFISNT